MRCRFLLGLIGRGGWRLKGLRDRLANFLEKVPNWLGVHASCIQKEQHGSWQRNPSRSDKSFNWVLGVQCGDGIFPQGRSLREAKKFPAQRFVLSSKRIMQPEQLGGIASQYDKDFVIIVLRNVD